MKEKHNDDKHEHVHSPAPKSIARSARVGIKRWCSIFVRFNGEPDGQIRREDLAIHLKHRSFTPYSKDGANALIDEAIESGNLTLTEDGRSVQLNYQP